MLGTRPLTEKEIEAMLNSFTNKRDRLLFLIGIKTGFRISELLSIKVCDIVEPTGFKNSLTVNRGYMKGKRESRSVPLHKDTVKEIKDYCSTLDSEQAWLFPSQMGGRLSRFQAWRAIKHAAMKCGISGKVACHSMRKTFAKKVHALLKRDLVKTQKALGHANINSTVRYLSDGDAEIDKAILKV